MKQYQPFAYLSVSHAGDIVAGIRVESVDCGLIESSTRCFVLSGMVVHELRWHACLEHLIEFRRRLKARASSSDSYGIVRL